MIKIILVGANGKMGQVITRIVSENESAKIVAGIDICTEKKSDYPVFSSFSEIGSTDADVIIDFSHPSSLPGTLDYAKKNNTAAVICTTGLNKEEINAIHSASEHIPMFFSANMSIGINLIIQLAQNAAKLLSDNFDIEIIEKHHNQKIDAPSGTALAIADGINEVLDSQDEYVFDRHSYRKKRSKNEIGIHSVRGGTIVGEHDIIFAGTDEIVEIKHTAASKEIFAVGAVKAAMFVAGRKPGFYDMNDLINF